MEKFDIMSLTVADFTLFSKLMEISKQASEYAKIVKENLKVSFAIGQDYTEVYSESAYGEYDGHGYLYHNGLYVYEDNWWGGRDWSIHLNEEEIFKVLRADFLIEEGRRDLLPDDQQNLDQFAPHLLRFLETI